MAVLRKHSLTLSLITITNGPLKLGICRWVINIPTNCVYTSNVYKSTITTNMATVRNFEFIPDVINVNGISTLVISSSQK